MSISCYSYLLGLQCPFWSGHKTALGPTCEPINLQWIDPFLGIPTTLVPTIPDWALKKVLAFKSPLPSIGVSILTMDLNFVLNVDFQQSPVQDWVLTIKVSQVLLYKGRISP